MVRKVVSIVYFPFFFGFAADFLAAGFFAAAFAAGAALADFFAAFAFVGSASLFPAFFPVARGPWPVARSSASGASVCPRAELSINTASDQRMWYVETS